MARISYTRVFTATTYAVELTDVNNAGNKVTDTTIVDDTEEGPWSSTLSAPVKGTYRFKVRAWGQGAAGPPCWDASAAQQSRLPVAVAAASHSHVAPTHAIA